jgi:hypothetical protein
MLCCRLTVSAFLISILVFAGVASGQGRDELQEQGPQPLQSDTTNQEQWLQPLQGDMANQGRQGLDSPKSIDKSDGKAKNIKTPKVTGIKKSAKSTISKPKSFGPSSRQYGIEKGNRSPVRLQVGSQIGASRSGLLRMGDNQSGNSTPNSFLDGYLQRSLAGSSLLDAGADQSGRSGSGSFLDDYLLKSLYSEELARKRSRSEEEPRDKGLARKKSSSEDKSKDDFLTKSKANSKL